MVHGFFGDTSASATYAGTAMTEVSNDLAAGARTFIWILVNPTSGANDVVISLGASSNIRGQALSYTGAKQSAQPDASVFTRSATVTTLTGTITTVADNCWAIVFAFQENGNDLTASTNVTSRRNTPAYIQSGDNNADITPAGNLSQTVTAASGDIRISQISIAPVLAAAENRGYAFIM